MVQYFGDGSVCFVLRSTPDHESLLCDFFPHGAVMMYVPFLKFIASELVTAV